jgi:hypothetical protein
MYRSDEEPCECILNIYRVLCRFDDALICVLVEARLTIALPNICLQNIRQCPRNNDAKQLWEGEREANRTGTQWEPKGDPQKLWLTDGRLGDLEYCHDGRWQHSSFCFTSSTSVWSTVCLQATATVWWSSFSASALLPLFELAPWYVPSSFKVPSTSFAACFHKVTKNRLK